MIHYIDKDTLLKEIEKLKCNLCPDFYQYNYDAAKVELLEKIEILINNLEGKNVDFIKEFYAFSEKHKLMDKGIEFSDIEKTASFFFQLGLKASNHITATDRGTAEEIIINLKRVEKDYRIDLTREIEWLRYKVKKGK
jgi:hypothetical protein